MTTFGMNNMHELTFYQLQQQAQELLKQSQNTILAAQLQLHRSQSVQPQQTSAPAPTLASQALSTSSITYTKRPAQRSLSDISAYYMNSTQQPLELQTPPRSPPGLSAPHSSPQQLILASLPQPPCVPLQRTDSIKSDGSLQAGSESTAGRYKTEMCRPFEETGHCRYGSKCQFAHGIREMRGLNRHPRYKTEFCRTYHTTGLCSYGQRCNFIHNEDERRAPHPSTVSCSRPQALPSSLSRHMPLTVTNSNGSSPASSIYGGDSSPAHSPAYLSDDPFSPCGSSRLSPAPSLSSFTSDYASSDQFPSPPSTPSHFDKFTLRDATMLSSPLDLGLSLLLTSKLNLRQ